MYALEATLLVRLSWNLSDKILHTFEKGVILGKKLGHQVKS